MRKTITFTELKRMSFTNSVKLPKAIVIDGERIRREWVGIGWIECGTPRGDETIVVDDGTQNVKRVKRQ